MSYLALIGFLDRNLQNSSAPKVKGGYILKQMMMKLWKDDRGQDLIEYALMAGFVAVAAGAIMPTVSQNVSEIFSKVSSVMTLANS